MVDLQGVQNDVRLKHGDVKRERLMKTSYETDVVVWANEQAAFIRAGRFDLLDLEHIAEEIEDVGKSEQRELANRMAVLLAHLLKWQYQPNRQGNSWARTIKEQRKGVLKRIKETPSLATKMSDDEWLDGVWSDAVAQAASETGIDTLPEACHWGMADILREGWLPTACTA